ncbi:MAG TPA: hypothetical protein DDX26_02130 [Candidatus Yonathbacteria bacterium]|nr:hypothetical protein [Candidatus Yonathbacteria bacterium]
MQSGIQFNFDEEQRPEYRRQGSKLVKVVIKLSGGRVDETQANYILLGVAVLALIISLFLFFSSKKMPYQPSQREILRTMTLPPVAPAPR